MPDEHPRITIIVAAYNAQRTLRAAVDSALRQDGASLEVLVVDDGSTDCTLEIARSLEGESGQVRTIAQPHSSTAAAANRALAEARGELIARLDADDKFADDYLAHMVRFIDEHPDFDIYSPDLLVIEADGSSRRLYGWSSTRSFDLKDMLERSVIPGAASMARRRVFEVTDGYREHIFSEDYDLWIRALALGMRHIYVPEPLYVYHQGESTRKSADLVSTYRSSIEIQKDLLASGTLGADMTAAVEASIAFLESLVAEAEHGDPHLRHRVVTRILESVRRPLAWSLGPDRADRVMARLIRAGRVFRPLWRRWVGLVVRIKGRRPRAGVER